MPHSNIEQLIACAALLRPLLGELVFVGGCVTSLLITDQAIGEPRTTLDVDAIAEITSYAAYDHFGTRLRELGFREDTSEGAPVCRWVQSRVILDVMPLDTKILGFSNRWYRAAMDRATTFDLAAGLTVRVIAASYFIATKLEAFKGRGGGDFFGSHDMEDVVFIVDGRPSLAQELRAEPNEFRQYLSNEVSGLLSNSKFLDALPGYLAPDDASQNRLGIILQRLAALVSG